MNGVLISLISLVYLGLLFYLAFIAEKFKNTNKSLINNPYVYALSLSVYCTAWTFFGSVGRVKTTGIEFLSVYFGPTFAMLVGWRILRKIIRISQVHSITSIADFISARYGKYRSLGVLVTIISLMAGVPYIGLQIKAISKSFEVLSGVEPGAYFFQGPSFFIVLVLIVFTLLFGTRKIQTNEKHEGMVFAIAVESIFKLAAFLVVGIYITYWLGGGISNVFEMHYFKHNIHEAFAFEKNTGYSNWFIHSTISAFAFMFLPRQFQVAVVENQNENNLKQALWLVPLYLFLINIFVIPIAIMGNSLLGSSTISADNYVIALPLHLSAKIIALIAYIGGFSAATGMIIVETIAISTMMTNSVILPLLLESERFKEKFTFKILNLAIWLRRACIVLTVILGYAYYRVVSDSFTLVSIGLIAFVAIAQFAPAVIGGIFWKEATKNGALVGLLMGGIIWFFALILPPFLVDNQHHFISLLAKDFYGFFEIFRIKDFDEISNASFWSLGLNMFCFFVVSINSKRTSLEAKQALLFVNVFEYSNVDGQSGTWKGKAKNENLKDLLASFLGGVKSREMIRNFASKNKIDVGENTADPKLVSYIENILSGIIGSSSARLLVSSISKEEVIGLDEMLNILKSSQKIIEDNEELRQKSEQLENLSVKLKNANEELLQSDLIRNEFLTTVTHEIRTPLTSIKALSEIIYDNEDLEEQQKKVFIDTIIKETNRLSRLVNQVLELERYESGKYVFLQETFEIKMMVDEVNKSMTKLANIKGIDFRVIIAEDISTYKGDEDKVIQMLINLISNAIKFTNRKDGKVSLNVFKQSENIVFEVSDNGVGIPKEMQKRLFEKFYQADNQNYATEKGSGLGLSITKKIVDIHNGKINLESETGQGCKFTISLPI